MPADNNETQRINSEFFNIVGPARDLDRNAAFALVAANLENLHYDFSISEFRGEPSYIELHCAEDYKVYIKPMYDENNAEENLAQWYEHEDAMRDYLKRYNQGITGNYLYKATFELVIDDWDPDSADEDNPGVIEGVVEFGSVDVTRYNFQEFIETAIFRLALEHEVELFPKRKLLKRKIA